MKLAILPEFVLKIKLTNTTLRWVIISTICALDETNTIQNIFPQCDTIISLINANMTSTYMLSNMYHTFPFSNTKIIFMLTLTLIILGYISIQREREKKGRNGFSFLICLKRTF